MSPVTRIDPEAGATFTLSVLQITIPPNAHSWRGLDLWSRKGVRKTSGDQKPIGKGTDNSLWPLTGRNLKNAELQLRTSNHRRSSPLSPAGARQRVVQDDGQIISPLALQAVQSLLCDNIRDGCNRAKRHSPQPRDV